jgi:phosphate transport system permease protein
MPAAEASKALLQPARYRVEPLVWLSASAVVLSVGLLVLLLSLLAVRGFAHFWPRELVMVELGEGRAAELGVVIKRQAATAAGAGDDVATPAVLLYRGRSERVEGPLLWLDERDIVSRQWPAKALRVAREQQEPVFGFLDSLSVGEESRRLAALSLEEQLGSLDEAMPASSDDHRGESSLRLRLASGELLELPWSTIREITAPNALSFTDKLLSLMRAVGRFVSEPPRQVNAEGGVFPAIVGTVVLVLLMSVMVTPLGVLAAIYLQEYAQRGVLTRLVRIAVNNLAGVPAIVYGVFGLGFFVYGLGGSLDSLLFADALPAPTLGTPGLLWASLTMALLTLPVVIVATEEGLARVPQSLREGSLALGATRAEALWRVVLPAASPALLTGLILAVARATGEVAPLILVGVAKYAPTLPVSGEFPFLHLDQQFMHLGFHIYDLGFQSPRLELTTDRVFATALLLVLIVLLLNLSAVILRSRLREAFKSQDLT